MEQLLLIQSQTGEAIERIISNYKKDSADRKTSVTYFQDRLSRMQDLAKELRINHDAILKIAGTDRTHQYFTKDYFTEIMARVGHYAQLFQQSILKLAPTKDQPDEPQYSGGTKHQESQEVDITHSLTLLIRKQRSMTQSLQRQFECIGEDSSQWTPEFCQVKRDAINGLWQQIQAINFAIYEQVDEPEDHGYDVHTYIGLDHEVQKTLISLMASSNKAKPQPETKAIMPKIHIPKFSGEYSKWPQFRDLYLEIIHNSTLPTIQKFWYLKSTLEGEALNLIRHFSLTQENYESAWTSLNDRFNNERKLTSSLLQKLIDQPTFTDTMSASAVKNLHDTTKETLLALKNLKTDPESWFDQLVIQILTKKLDHDTHELYEQSIDDHKKIQSLGKFIAFLEDRFESIEALRRKERGSTKKSVAYSLVSHHEDKKCYACGQGTHPLYKCNAFKQLTVDKRVELIKKHQLCLNCLRTGHRANNCKSGVCSKCQEKHNTLLHVDTASAKQSNHLSQANPVTLLSSQSRGFVILGTARVKIHASNGNSLECRALLDSGSQVNLITNRIVKRLGFKTQATSVQIEGIGNNKEDSNQRVCFTLSSTVNGFSTPVEALVLSNIISSQPSTKLNTLQWDIPKNVALADPQFNLPGNIDILLGAEFYYQLLSIGQIKLGEELPILQNTTLGWVVSGKIGQGHTPVVTCGVFSDSDNTTNDIISRFWKLDEFGDEDGELTGAERECEKHFIKHMQRDAQGKYTVRLPLCKDPSELSESSTIALNRFFAIERRLARDNNLKSQYVDFMREYERLGHMVKVNKDDIPSPHYMIPHHCVLKADSSTTKLRVVFDASCTTTSGLSLNDIMYTGPRVQSELISILLRFRLPRFVMTTDVEKMYRQMFVHPEDDMLQLIIWREDPSMPIQYYRLRTVTYGTRSAPYLATRCLKALSKESERTYPIGAAVLHHEFYVDDGIFGSDSLVGAIDQQQQLITILKSAGMNLRKWSANHPQLLQGILSSDKEVDLDFDTDTSESIKTLGLVWMPKEDNFQIRAKIEPNSRITKRTITSDVARIFDPLGLLAPVVVMAEIIIQQLWQLKLDWDEAVPAEIHTRWSAFRSELHQLNDVKIPRHMFNHNCPHSIQLHGFADASAKAYGAAIYIRATFKNGIVIVRLLCAKSRVAPLKTQTIPRLELCAALMATQLMNRIKKDLNFENRATFLWSDSEIVLSWINTCSSTFQSFVSHRIAKIQELSNMEQWRHVRSKDNPADLLSRVSPKDIADCHLWFVGPFFLHGDESLWPKPFQQTTYTPTREERKRAYQALTIAEVTSPGEWIYGINAGNSIFKLQRILCFVKRFVLRYRRIKVSTTRIIAFDELNNTLPIIIKAIQCVDFKDDIKHITTFKEVSKSSAIQSLSPFLDENGVLRVGGRLDNADLSYDAKYPMLLPYNHPIVKTIMIDCHIKNLHCGPQTLLAILRQRFWPIKGKTMARSIVQHCVRCTKAKPTMLQQVMGNLPEHRVKPARPFLNAGVDYCGPFQVHYKIRGKKPHKAYIAVFCCFATRAVHLELVTELTTAAFLGALRRFIARRGSCQHLYCDNATNFVGAKNELKELAAAIFTDSSQEKIINDCNQQGINFHFIPPRAPHFGGLWEAAVKSAKHLLVRSANTANLTYEELETLVLEIEAIMNSRPLTPMSSNPNDLTALTPGHFLIGEPMTAVPEPTPVPIKSGLLSRWKLVNQLKHEFWKRWTVEYLSELQQRHKWKQRQENIKAGQLVLINEDNTPPLQWPMGRILNIYKGHDGLVRFVDIKTKRGISKRSIHRLAPLLPEETTCNESIEQPEITTENPTGQSKRRRITPAPIPHPQTVCSPQDFDVTVS